MVHICNICHRLRVFTSIVGNYNNNNNVKLLDSVEPVTTFQTNRSFTVSVFRLESKQTRLRLGN